MALVAASEPSDNALEVLVAKSNAALLNDVKEARAAILSTPPFSTDGEDEFNMASANPISLEAGSSIPPFDRDAFDKKMEAGQPYTAGGNLFWIDEQKVALLATPFSYSRVKFLRDSKYQKPGIANDSWIIQVTAADFKPDEAKGSLQHSGPEENALAKILVVKRDIDANVDIDI